MVLLLFIIELHKVLVLKYSSNTCNRYIDTGRVNKYLITSEPIDNTPKV